MYSPKIDEEQIRRLYRLKLKTQETIAQMVREAVEEYLNKPVGMVGGGQCIIDTITVATPKLCGKDVVR